MLLQSVGLGLALASVYGRFLPYVREMSYNADFLNLPSLYRDLAGGVDISGWRYPGAPQWFPDATLFVLISAIIPSIHAANAAYGLVQLTLFMLGVYALGRQTLTPRYGPRATRTVVIMAATIALALDQEWVINSFWILMPEMHVGVFVASPYVLALTHGLASEGSRRLPMVAGLGFVSVAVGMSDSLFLPQVVAPLCLTLSVLLWLRVISVRRWIVAVVTPLVGAAIGFGLSRWIVGETGALEGYLQFAKVTLAAENARTVWLGLLTDHPFHVTTIAAFVGLCSFIVGRAIRRGSLDDPTQRLGQLLFPVYFLFLFATNWISVIATGVFAHTADLRYLIPTFVLPAAWGVPFVLDLQGAIRHPAFSSAVVVVTALTTLSSATSLPTRTTLTEFFAEYYPPWVRCVDENAARLGLKYGVAEYWTARPITMMSKRDLQVVQVQRDMSPLHWVNNSAWFDIQPEFVVTETETAINRARRLDEGLIAERFGPPATTFECNPHTILVYNRTQDVLFEQFLRQSTLMNRVRKPGDVAEFFAAFLPSKTGVIRGLARVADGAPEGTLSHGPYLALPPGEYAFGIDYLARNGDGHVGTWDVLAWNWKAGAPNPTGFDVAHSGVIEDQNRSASGSFRLFAPRVLEVRVHYSGHGRLEVNKIRIERLK